MIDFFIFFVNCTFSITIDLRIRMFYSIFVVFLNIVFRLGVVVVVWVGWVGLPWLRDLLFGLLVVIS